MSAVAVFSAADMRLLALQLCSGLLRSSLSPALNALRNRCFKQATPDNSTEQAKILDFGVCFQRLNEVYVAVFHSRHEHSAPFLSVDTLDRCVRFVLSLCKGDVSVVQLSRRWAELYLGLERALDGLEGVDLLNSGVRKEIDLEAHFSPTADKRAERCRKHWAHLTESIERELQQSAAAVAGAAPPSDEVDGGLSASSSDSARAPTAALLPTSFFGKTAADKGSGSESAAPRAVDSSPSSKEASGRGSVSASEDDNSNSASASDSPALRGAAAATRLDRVNSSPLPSQIAEAVSVQQLGVALVECPPNAPPEPTIAEFVALAESAAFEGEYAAPSGIVVRLVEELHHFSRGKKMERFCVMGTLQFSLPAAPSAPQSFSFTLRNAKLLDKVVPSPHLKVTPVNDAVYLCTLSTSTPAGVWIDVLRYKAMQKVSKTLIPLRLLPSVRQDKRDGMGQFVVFYEMNPIVGQLPLLSVSLQLAGAASPSVVVQAKPSARFDSSSGAVLWEVRDLQKDSRRGKLIAVAQGDDAAQGQDVRCSAIFGVTGRTLLDTDVSINESAGEGAPEVQRVEKGFSTVAYFAVAEKK